MDEDIPFDPETIRTFAQRVNRAAGRQVFGMTVLGLLIGAAVGGVLSNAVESAIFFGVFTALIGGVAGFLVGDAHWELMQLNLRVALSQVAADETPPEK